LPSSHPRGRPTDDGETGSGSRRRYDSPVRRAQAGETRERIVAAGAQLVHGSPRRNWRDITVKAVAECAGVNHRTVYRHFASERELHDAIVRRLEEEAGQPLAGLELDELPEVTARVFSYMATFALQTARQDDNESLSEIDDRRRRALIDAVAARTDEWSEPDQTKAAAVLDVLWTINAFDRLTLVWGLDPADASAAVAGVVRLIVDAIDRGEVPWSP
jgi:AcrR family transcriptional regulator